MYIIAVQRNDAASQLRSSDFTCARNAPEFRPYHLECLHSVIECDFKNGCCVPPNVSCERTLLQAKLPTVTSKVLADGNRFEISRWAEFE